jgi:predicted dehydrogenase
MAEIGIGIVGGGYMGKAHAVAMAAVGAVFDTDLRPRLEMVCAPAAIRPKRYRARLRLRARTADWRELVADPRSRPWSSPRRRARTAPSPRRLRARQAGVLRKAAGRTLEDSRAMVAAAEASGAANMVGFNYIRTPASQFARS